MRGLDDHKSLLGHRRTRGRIAPGLKIVVLIAVSIALIVIDQTHDSLAPVRNTLAVAMAPIQTAAGLPGQALAYLQRFFNRSGLIERNEQLARQVLRLQGRLQRFAALKAENKRIRALLDSANALEQNVRIARILTVSPDPYRQYVKLNKGSAAGVFAGQALIDAHGIMGQIIRVTPVSARAVLISNANASIPVAINLTGLATIAQGTGRVDALSLPFLTRHADIKIGDLLISSGLGGHYPAGYPVATVSRIAYRPGTAFLRVTARPTAHLDRGREVLLVWNRHTAPNHPQTASQAMAGHDGT